MPAGSEGVFSGTGVDFSAAGFDLPTPKNHSELAFSLISGRQVERPDVPDDEQTDGDTDITVNLDGPLTW